MTPDLRTRLAAMGISQTAFAELMGVTVRAVQKWCARGRAPQPVEMLLLAATELAKPAGPLVVLQGLARNVKGDAK